MTNVDETPYKCSECVDKNFKSLVGLRMHSATMHAMLEATTKPNAKFQVSRNEDENIANETTLDSDIITMDSNKLNEMPDAIEKIFEKFNRRAEMLLQKYDRSFADIEEELRLSGKLRMIKKRKDKLKADLNKWEGADTTRAPIKKKEPYVLQRPQSEDEQEKDAFSEKELKVKEREAAKTTMNNLESNPTADEALERKLEMSIQLAAKYKEQAIRVENQLHNAMRSEQNMRSYLQDATQKEAVAKKRLEEFITDLLKRAETAEEKVKKYKSRLSFNDSGYGKKSSENKRYPRSMSTESRSPTEERPPPHPKVYSSSAPTTPRQPNRTRRPRSKADEYVSQLLEPPSSQELPRRWNKRKKNRSVDQLPGIDLSNIISTSVVWPFSEAHSFGKKNSRSARSTSPESSSVSFPDVPIRRRIVLFCTFAYLDTETLLRCSLVCREWRDVSKHPKLWTRVSLHSKQISSEFLASLSTWCTETSYISLSHITGRSRNPGETSEEFADASNGNLEDGMECLLQSCGSKLLVLSISKCDPFLTRRVLWLASCYNRELKSITFRSCEPLNAEITWSLGAGCRKLLSMDIAPTKYCKTPAIFNNRVVQMISWCWPNLRGLSIGGKCIDKKGLLSIASSCQNIQVLELANMDEVSEDLAKELIKTGLSSLHSLILMHTPIRTRALSCLLRLAAMGKLVSLHVQLSFADYCPAQDNQPAVILDGKMDRSELFEAFNAVMKSLVRLQKKPEYNNILEVICTA